MGGLGVFGDDLQYILERTPTELEVLLADRYPGRITEIQQTAIRRLLKYVSVPGFISFGGGFPDPSTFCFAWDDARLSHEIISSLSSKGLMPAALTYSQSEGVPYLKDAMREHLLSPMGISAAPGGLDDIIITTGAQQALSGIGKMFVTRERGTILTEDPTYVGALGAFEQGKQEIAQVAMDEYGMRPDALEAEIQRRFQEGGPDSIKFIYAIPNFQNPSGKQMPLERKIDILRIAWKYNIDLIEDDPYPLMHLPGDPLIVSMKAIEQQWIQQLGIQGTHVDSHVTYIGTFSKTLGAGLRVGFIVAPKKVADQSAAWIGRENLMAPTFTQFMVAEYLNLRGYDGLVQDTERARSVYAGKLDMMESSIRKEFAGEMKSGAVSFEQPRGGLFLWPKFNGIDTFDMLEFAIALSERYDRLPAEIATRLGTADDYKLIWVPGKDSGANNFEHMRLNYSFASDQNIQIGISRLKRIYDLYGQYRSGGFQLPPAN
jgi:2-aminoadipate transaminase